jgi:hypothetical protein
MYVCMYICIVSDVRFIYVDLYLYICVYVLYDGMNISNDKYDIGQTDACKVNILMPSHVMYQGIRVARTNYEWKKTDAHKVKSAVCIDHDFTTYKNVSYTICCV